MTIDPLVSIALCTYNGEKFLVKQLDSLLYQEYANIEIIAVDDCSSDNTWAILQDYARKDKRMKPFQNIKNLGYNRNFEKAIKLCGGGLIALADQDDIWEKDKIGIMVYAIADSIMVYHDSDFIDDNDNPIGQIIMSSRFCMYQGESSLPFILANCISGHAILFKKELVKYFLPFNDVRYHDWWIAYVASNIGKVKFVDKVLVHYRQHPHSITDSLQLREENAKIGKRKNLGRLSAELNWLSFCSKYKYNREPYIILEACTLFTDLINGKNKFRCFLFMMKHFDQLFYIIGNKHRGFFSKINFVRKLCYR